MILITKESKILGGNLNAKFPNLNSRIINIRGKPLVNQTDKHIYQVIGLNEHTLTNEESMYWTFLSETI